MRPLPRLPLPLPLLLPAPPLAELLEILGSIINGFALPLKEEHKHFLKRALMPLHKPKCLPAYHQQLSYCVTQVGERAHGGGVALQRARDSPRTSRPRCALPAVCGEGPAAGRGRDLLLAQVLAADKQPQGGAVLGGAGGGAGADAGARGATQARGRPCLRRPRPRAPCPQAEEFARVVEPLFKQIARCLTSSHFQVAERSLFLWNNEYIVQQVAQHRCAIAWACVCWGGGRGRLAGWGVTSRRCHGPRQGKVTRRLCAPPRAQGDGGAVGCGRAGAQCQAPLEPGSAQPHAQRAQDAHRTGRPVILASSATARGCRVTAGRCVITPRRGGVCGCGLAAVLARSLTPGPARAAGG